MQDLENIPSGFMQIGTTKNNGNKLSKQSPVHNFEIQYQPPDQEPEIVDENVNVNEFIQQHYQSQEPEKIIKQESNETYERPEPKPKYHIMDLFWLINEKLCRSEQLEENEAQFVTISYNMDFGNLRINLYDIPDGAIQKNVVFNQSLKLKITATIYPSSCFQLMHADNDCEFMCIEQLLTDLNEQWQKERPVSVLSRNDNNIRLTVTDPKTQNVTFFDFIGWQKKAFEEALQYAYKDGLKLRGINILKKNLKIKEKIS